ncbi:MAG: non-homologous end-joining DNA ligase [Myxococcaceae bacterium]
MAVKKKAKKDGPRFPPRSARGLAARNRLAPLTLLEPGGEAELLTRADWHFEVFWDEGYRVQAVRFGDDIGLFADDLREWTGPAAAITLALKDLRAEEFVLDGWLCVLDDSGRPDFEKLKARVNGKSKDALVFMVSDLAWLARAPGEPPVSTLPLRRRRELLRDILPAGHRSLLPPQELDGALQDVTRSLESLGLHALLARRASGEGGGLVVSVDDEPIPLVRSLSAAPRVTNQDKVLFPRDGFTKTDLVAYYRDVAPTFLRYLQQRPVVAQRWPDGIDEFTWFQHRAPPRAPDYLKTVRIQTDSTVSGTDRRILMEDLDALLWMVNQAALTFHGWASRVGNLASPDWAIIDLDPGTDTTWPQTIEVALAIRALLELLQVDSVVKTSGQKGIHVLVPLAAGHTLTQAWEFASLVCSVIAQLKPELVSLEAETGPRRGRLFLDALQNYEGKTLVLPYSVRAADAAPVSMPIRWDEVTERLNPKDFTIRTARARLDAHGDLFAGALKGKVQLAPVLEKLKAK